LKINRFATPYEDGCPASLMGTHDISGDNTVLDKLHAESPSDCCQMARWRATGSRTHVSDDSAVTCSKYPAGKTIFLYRIREGTTTGGMHANVWSIIREMVAHRKKIL